MGNPRLFGILYRNNSRGERSHTKFGILATFFMLTATPAAIFTTSAYMIAAPSAAISSSSAVVTASAVAAMFSIHLIFSRLLLTAGDLEFKALQGRVPCAEVKGASDGEFIVASVATGGQHRSASGGRVLAFKPLLLVYPSTLDTIPCGPVRQAL